MDDECAELESEYPQVRKIINNANDLAESKNSRRPSNWKSLSKIYYPNPQLGPLLVSLLKMIPPKSTLCSGCRKKRTLQVQPQMGLYEENRGLVVVGKAQRALHKDSSGALQYIRQIYEMFIFMSIKDAFLVFFH